MAKEDHDFVVELIPANRWSRQAEDHPLPVNEERLHFIPVSDRARKFVQESADHCTSSPLLRISLLVDHKERFAFRWSRRKPTEERVEKILAWIGEWLEKFEKEGILP